MLFLLLLVGGSSSSSRIYNKFETTILSQADNRKHFSCRASRPNPRSARSNWPWLWYGRKLCPQGQRPARPVYSVYSAGDNFSRTWVLVVLGYSVLKYDKYEKKSRICVLPQAMHMSDNPPTHHPELENYPLGRRA